MRSTALLFRQAVEDAYADITTADVPLGPLETTPDTAGFDGSSRVPELDPSWCAVFFYSDGAAVQRRYREGMDDVIAERQGAERDRERAGEPARVLVRLHLVAPDWFPAPQTNPRPLGVYGGEMPD